MALDQVHELGHGHVLRPWHDEDGRLMGWFLDHPFKGKPAQQCVVLVVLDRSDVVSEEPLMLKWPIRCGACEARGWVRNGGWADA